MKKFISSKLHNALPHKVEQQFRNLQINVYRLRDIEQTAPDRSYGDAQSM
jgi:hypothetical protein